MTHFDIKKPFVGFHTRFGNHDSVDSLLKLAKEGLKPNGINTIILELNPGYTYKCFPEYSNGTVTYEDCVKIREECKKLDIAVIPLFQCLSHQSMNFGDNSVPWPLLQAHPEFCETPEINGGKPWPDFYVHTWCASNKDIYKYIFPMMDEVLEAFDIDVMHIGLDEVFDIGEDTCKLCKGKNRAELFAEVVKELHDHLADKGVQTMMWGDRLLDAEKLGYQMWEADKFGMHPAFDMADKVTRDIIICDWHYDLHDHGYPSVNKFIKAGFDVLPSLGSDEEQAEHFWKYACEDIYLGRKYGYKGKVAGMLFTHWGVLTQESAEDILAGINGAPKGDMYSSVNVGRTIAKLSKKKDLIR